jgi:probable HAF family extracellular repeat protein
MKTQIPLSHRWSTSQRLFALMTVLTLAAGSAWAKKPQPPPEPPPESGYRLVDLGTLGGNSSFGFKVNNFGCVVGASVDLAGNNHAFVVIPQDTDEDTIPDVWVRDDNGDGANDLMIDLGVLGSGLTTSSHAWGINDPGQVVGESTVDAGENHVMHAVLWQDADNNGEWEAVDLGAMSPGGNSRALAVNTSGQVVGCSDGPLGSHAFLINPVLDAMGNAVWFVDANNDLGNDLMIDLGNLAVTDINDAGEIVGSAAGLAVLIRPVDMDGDGQLDWFWDGNADAINDLMIPLPPVPGAQECEAQAINAHGLIAGRSKGHAVLWQVDGSGTILQTDLGGLENEDGTDPQDLNDDGLVVGCALTVRGRQESNMRYSYNAWLLEGGTPVKLSDRIVDWGGFLTEYGIPFAHGVNNSAQIVGNTYANDGNLHSYIAIPVP